MFGVMESPDFSMMHKLSSVIGWVELGNFGEAEAELSALERDFPDHTDVLELRWLLHSLKQEWELGLEVAKRLVELKPDEPAGWLHRAYALRRVKEGGLQEAWQALLPAWKRFPQEGTIAYNLACYACQMGRLDEARSMLDQAARVGGKERIKEMGLNDRDLEVLWPEIRKW